MARVLKVLIPKENETVTSSNMTEMEIKLRLAPTSVDDALKPINANPSSSDISHNSIIKTGKYESSDTTGNTTPHGN